MEKRNRADIVRDGVVVAQGVTVADGVYFAVTGDNGQTWWGHSFESVTLEVWASRFDPVIA